MRALGSKIIAHRDFKHHIFFYLTLCQCHPSSGQPYDKDKAARINKQKEQINKHKELLNKQKEAQLNQQKEIQLNQRKQKNAWAWHSDSPFCRLSCFTEENCPVAVQAVGQSRFLSFV